MKNLPTHARLKEVLHYDPVLGLFWWKERPVTTRHDRMFNTKHSGQIAGTRSRGYAVIKVDGEDIHAHRLAWFYMTGQWPAEEIDHRNGRRLDNAFDNLREATRSQNGANRSRQSEGLRGVSKSGSKFRSRIKYEQTEEYLGTFDTEEEAHTAYAARAVQVFGEYARIAG